MIGGALDGLRVGEVIGALEGMELEAVAAKISSRIALIMTDTNMVSNKI